MKTYIVLFDMDAHPEIDKYDMELWAEKTFKTKKDMETFFYNGHDPLILSLESFMVAYNNDTFFQGDIYLTYVYVEED